MDFVVGANSESFSAYRAMVTVVACMELHVPIQVTLRVEFLKADFTREGRAFFSSIFNHIRFLPKSKMRKFC